MFKDMSHPESIEDLREQILTLGVCTGPYDSPHRCSALHCDHCGLCDVSEDLIKLVATQVNEALLAEVRAIYKELSSDDPEFNRAYFKVRIHELQSLQDKEVK